MAQTIFPGFIHTIKLIYPQQTKKLCSDFSKLIMVYKSIYKVVKNRYKFLTITANSVYIYPINSTTKSYRFILTYSLLSLPVNSHSEFPHSRCSHFLCGLLPQAPSPPTSSFLFSIHFITCTLFCTQATVPETLVF